MPRALGSFPAASLKEIYSEETLGHLVLNQRPIWMHVFGMTGLGAANALMVEGMPCRFPEQRLGICGRTTAVPPAR